MSHNNSVSTSEMAEMILSLPEDKQTKIISVLQALVAGRTKNQVLALINRQESQ